MTARDALLKYLITPIGCPAAASAFSSLVGPMDDPVSIMGRKAKAGDYTRPPSPAGEAGRGATGVAAKPPSRNRSSVAYGFGEDFFRGVK
jgi:hypothetical protein